jgi:hypothetical protein
MKAQDWIILLITETAEESELFRLEAIHTMPIITSRKKMAKRNDTFRSAWCFTTSMITDLTGSRTMSIPLGQIISFTESSTTIYILSQYWSREVMQWLAWLWLDLFYNYVNPALYNYSSYLFPPARSELDSLHVLRLALRVFLLKSPFSRNESKVQVSSHDTFNHDMSRLKPSLSRCKCVGCL